MLGGAASLLPDDADSGWRGGSVSESLVLREHGLNLMNNKVNQQSRYGDEITMVDLTTTFVSHRRVFYVVFGGVVLLALLYTLFFLGEVKEYSTLVQLAEDDSKPLESPAAVIASVDSRWYPEIHAAYVEAEGQKLPFKVVTSNPKDTNLMKLSSETSPEIGGVVGKIHEQLVAQIVQRQSHLLDRQKRTLEQRLSSINGTLEELSSQQAGGEVVAQAIQERGDLEAQLESLQPAEVLVVARESLDNSGISKSVILAIAIVLGLMLGILSAFIAELVVKVRFAMKEQSAEL